MNLEMYRQLFERSVDAHLVIEAGRFMDCNAAAVAMLGYRHKKEALVVHPFDVSPPLQADGRSSRDHVNENNAIAMDRGSYRFEWYHQRADGEVFPVEVLLTAITNGEKTVLHVVWYDISERKKKEENLRRLSSILESTNDMIATATPDGRILYLNDAGRAMLGLDSRASLHDKSIKDFHPQEMLTDNGRQYTIWRGDVVK